MDRIAIATYPKTGSTWLRFFIANAMKNSGKPEDEWEATDFWTVHDVVPDLDDNNEFRGQRIAKTHRSYHLFDKYPFEKTILLIRNPYDVMVSFYHYYWSFKGRKRNWQPVEMTQLIKGKAPRLSRVSDTGIKGYVNHVNSYHDIEPKEVVKYEFMRFHNVDYFGAILDFCEIPNDDKLVKWCMEEASFDKMTKVEDERGKKYSDGFKFCRSGEVGQWKEELEEEHIEYVKNEIKNCPILETHYG